MENTVPPTKTASEVIALRAPALSGDSREPALIVLADELLGNKVPVGGFREYAKALQVLHWLELSKRNGENPDGGGGVGSVTMEKEGELTIKYGNTGTNVMYFTSSWKADMMQTVWGMELYSFMMRFITSFSTRYSR